VPGLAERGVQLLGGLAGGCCLCGVCLRLPQSGYRVSQCHQACYQRPGWAAALASGLAGHGEQPRGRPQLVPVPAAAGDAAVRRAGGPVVTVHGARAARS